MKNIVSVILASSGILIYVILGSNCKKEYSYEGGTAVFSMNNISGSCGGSMVKGNYYTGTILDPSNTVQLQVYVTDIGKYTLQTNTRAGFQFSAAGRFTDTGVQAIILSGTGSPDTTGIFPFTPGLPESCSFLVPVTQKQTLKAIYALAGAPNQCSNTQVNGSFSPGKALTISNFVLIYVNVTSAGDYTISTDTLEGISFSGSGSFTKTGVQPVTLYGSGTPANAGDLVFTTRSNGTGCTFSLPVLNPGPLAAYVIESGGNFCVGLLTGIYKAGMAMTVSNTYTLTVYVTNPGNFTISTKTVDGIRFSATGTFTVIGAQKVMLIAIGTPANAGTYTITPEIAGPSPLGGQACDFSLIIY
jgi:hypothetical protein